MERSESLSVALPAVCILVSYFFTYVVKYSIFVVDYGDTTVGGVALKELFGYALTVGYGVGKIPAYMFAPGIQRRYRLRTLVLLNAAYATLSVIFLPFGAPLAILQVLGLALGCAVASAIFGLVLAYVEGRRSSEILLATLNMVVVFGAGICRALARKVLDLGVPGRWMPAACTLAYAPLAFTALYVLDAMPEPSAADVASRSARVPMISTDKTRFLQRHWLGLGAVLAGYMALIGYRSFRDFFAREIYREALDREATATEYLLADSVGGGLSCLLLLAMSRSKNNGRALVLMHWMLLTGGVIMGGSTLLHAFALIGPLGWIVLVGTGVYVALTPFCGAYFDRIIAVTRTRGTSVFLVFLADGLGYVGTFALLLFKTLSVKAMSFERAFVLASYVCAVALSAGSLAAMAYWSGDDRRQGVTVTVAGGGVGQQRRHGAYRPTEQEDWNDIVDTDGGSHISIVSDIASATNMGLD